MKNRTLFDEWDKNMSGRELNLSRVSCFESRNSFGTINKNRAIFLVLKETSNKSNVFMNVLEFISIGWDKKWSWCGDPTSFINSTWPKHDVQLMRGVSSLIFSHLSFYPIIYNFHLLENNFCYVFVVDLFVFLLMIAIHNDCLTSGKYIVHDLRTHLVLDSWQNRII